MFHDETVKSSVSKFSTDEKKEMTMSSATGNTRKLEYVG